MDWQLAEERRDGLWRRCVAGVRPFLPGHRGPRSFAARPGIDGWELIHRAGCDAHVAKPIGDDDLVDEVLDGLGP
jgi:hypothetical protein